MVKDNWNARCVLIRCFHLEYVKTHVIIILFLLMNREFRSADIAECLDVFHAIMKPVFNVILKTIFRSQISIIDLSAEISALEVLFPISRQWPVILVCQDVENVILLILVFDYLMDMLMIIQLLDILSSIWIRQTWQESSLINNPKKSILVIQIV